VRLDIRRIGALKKEEDVIGNRTRVKVVKNKMAPPFKEVEFDILYGHGISREGDLVDLSSEANIVEKSGAWFSYNGERIGQGRENAKQFLIDHPEIYNAIEAKVLAHHNVRRIGIEVAPETTPVAASAPAPAATLAPAATPAHAVTVDDRTGKATRPSAPTAPASSASSPAGPSPNGKRPNA
jgi:recombination protein RecA